MSVSSPRVLSTNTIVASPALAAETVVAQLDGVATRGPGGAVILRGVVNIAAGTGASALYLRIRRGSTAAGTLVGTQTTSTVTASDTYTVPVEVIDNPGEVADQPYVLTAQLANATAASTVEAVSLTATY